MKVLLDIRDDKVPFILEILSGFKYVKTKPLKEENSLFLSELRGAVEEMKLIKSGKLKGRPIDDLLNEL